MSEPGQDDPTGEGPERDPWLHRALSHAPDANVRASPEVSRQILRQARAATAAKGQTGENAMGWLNATWSWLGRTPVAAGLTSVMVAVLAGLMWWDRPADEVLPPASSATTARPGPSAASAATTPAGTSSGLSETASPATGNSAATPLNVPAPRDSAKALPRAPQPKESPAVAAAPAPRAVPPVAAATPLARSRTADSASVKTAQPRGEANDTLAQTPPGEPTALAGATAGATTSASTPALALAAPRSAQARRVAQGEIAGATSSPLTALIASVAQEPQRWSWQRSGATQPMSAALRRWLIELNESTASLWRASQGSAQADRSALRLYRDNDLYATLNLDEQGAWVTLSAPTPSNWGARLQASTIEALRRSLSGAAP
jgi:hypothetical protein